MALVKRIAISNNIIASTFENKCQKRNSWADTLSKAGPGKPNKRFLLKNIYLHSIYTDWDGQGL
jgi:hypothetical protein